MARGPKKAVAAARHARRRAASLSFDALLVEGSLIAPAQLARVAAREAGEQADPDYGVKKGLVLREEIARFFRIGQAHFAELTAGGAPGHAATTRFIENLLKDVLEFPDLVRVGWREHDGRFHPVTLEALGGRVPVVVVPPADPLDRPSEALSREGGHRTSAALALQDWLNVADGALWGICCNGERLRLVRDNPSLTRPASIEADLRRMFEGEAFADFTAFWLLLHASRFGLAGNPDKPTLPSDCALERWRDAGQKAGVAARDRLARSVEAALEALGTGFLSHSASAAQRGRITGGDLPLPEFHGALLRIVYRLIFLLVAEDRSLLHPPDVKSEARKLYAEGYSVSRLRDRAVKRQAWDTHDDLWDGCLIVFDALGARGEPTLGLPALGGLFELGGLGCLEGASLGNKALMKAVFGLGWLKDEGALAPVNWRDMETEELGSVYESLLELTPRISADGRSYGFAAGAETKGNQRKTTGSYYTPDSLVQLLLDSALDPVLDAAERGAEDQAEALLNVTVIDPACGSGHFLLAAARRIATRVARARTGGPAGAEDYRHALREVARRCIHGVDRNPMAVELTKVALWIETVEPGRALGFLDANIRCGDALLGIYDLAALEAGIPDAAYKPLAGDDKAACRALAKRNKTEREGQGRLDFSRGGGRLPPAAPLARAERDWRALPEDSPDEVAQKRARFEAARADPRAWPLRVACDLYTAAFLTPKAAGAEIGTTGGPASSLVSTTADVWTRAGGSGVYGPREGRAVDLARTARAFHWPLEFPDVMAAGGFDCVLGNPPWERIKLQEQEFFAPREPVIAEASNAAARAKLIAVLAAAPLGSRDRALFDQFEQAKRTAEAASVFARVPGEEGGRFPLTGRGDVNTYALFAELFATLVGPRGRAGVIVPTGIATDATTAAFFGALISGRRLASLHDFQTGLGYFDDIGHARFKFCLLTVVTSGSGPDSPAFSFFSRTAEEFADPRRHFRLSTAEIAHLNPNTRTVATFRTAPDAELTARIYDRVPVLIDESKGATGNPWAVSFMAMLHMSNDSGLFRTAAQLAETGLVRDGTDWVPPGGLVPRQSALSLVCGTDVRSLALDSGGPSSGKRYVPLYEAKMIHQFDHRWATYDGVDSRDAAPAEKVDPSFEPEPRYWVPAAEVDNRLRDKGWTRGWLVGWRDIARATDERTVIATVFPRVGVGHVLPLFFTREPVAKVAALVGNLGSLVLDYVARQKVGGTHLTYGYLNQFPVLPPTAYTDADLAFIVPRVLELTYTSWSLAPFARDLDHAGPPFPWDEDRRARLRAELDARYAELYGLDLRELKYVLDPADVMGADYPSETFRVLKANEQRRFQRYRTRDLVLAAWDEQETTRGVPLAAPLIVLPRVHPSTRPDNDWARPAADAVARRLQTRAQVAAVLKALTGPMPAEQVRLAALFALEPRFLTARLSGAERAQWRRVVGPEADSPSAGVVPLGLGGATGWGDALDQLKASNSLIIDPAQSSWAPGPGLAAYEAVGWVERAGFALDVAGRIVSDSSATLTAEELSGLAILAA